MSSEYFFFFADNECMKRISLVFAAAFFTASFCAAQNFPSTDLSNFRQEGIASWYGAEFNGRPTASGEIFSSSLYTAAHPTLPFGTWLTVTNLNNGRKVNVRVNDRGPFISSRIIDLSQAAAQMLDMVGTGIAPVLIEALNNYNQAVDPAYRPGAGSSSVPSAPYQGYQSNPYQAPQEQVRPSQTPQYLPQPVQPQQPQYGQQSQYDQQPQQMPPMQPQAQQPVVVLQPPQQTQQMPDGSQPVQSIQPLQIQIPIEVKPIVSTGAYPPAASGAEPAASPAAANPPPAAPAASPAPANPAQPAPASPRAVPVIPVPESASAAAVPPIQVTIRPNAIYRVQIGSFKEARNALTAFERLKEAGLNPVYERNDNYFRVVLSGIPSDEIAGVLQKVQAAGFSDLLLREEQ
jgi:rare lipoprotein A